MSSHHHRLFTLCAALCFITACSLFSTGRSQATSGVASAQTTGGGSGGGPRAGGGASSGPSATPNLNLGRGIGLRFENAAENNEGVTKLVLSNVFFDSRVGGPFVLTLEQSGRVLGSGTCEGREDTATGLGMLYLSEECGTPYIPSSSIRTDQPVDVALALVDDASDTRTELYRGTFPVVGFMNWLSTDNDQAIHAEQRALRLDSLYGAAFVRQDSSGKIQFTFVDARHANDVANVAARCRVGTGEWQSYGGELFVASSQVARNRVWVGDSLREEGPETIVTQVVEIPMSLPLSVAGAPRAPQAGNSMDGSWTCEVRAGGTGARVLMREFRFEVRGGIIQPSAIDAQIAPGRNAVLVSVGMNPEAMPVIFDPALVRGAFAGRTLTGASAPFVSAMPARATNPAFTTLPRAAGRAGHGRGRAR